MNRRTPSSPVTVNVYAPETGAFSRPVHFTEKKFEVIGEPGEPPLQLKSTVASVRVSTGGLPNGLINGYGELLLSLYVLPAQTCSHRLLRIELALGNSLGCLSGIAPLQPTCGAPFVLIVVQLDVI